MNIIRTLLKIFTGVVTLTVFSADLNAQPGGLQLVDVVRLDRRIDKLVPSNARVEKIAGGHKWVEGPVWNRQEGYLLFSDIPANAIFQWREGNGVSLFLRPSGYSGAMPFAGTEPGSNGLAYDPAGRLVLAEHGDPRLGPGVRTYRIRHQLLKTGARHSGITHSTRLKEGIMRKILTGTSASLDLPAPK